MTQSPPVRVHGIDFDKLMGILDVSVRSLIEVSLVAGVRVNLPASDTSVLCFCLRGDAQAAVGGHSPVALRAGTVIIGPPGQALIVRGPEGGPCSRALDLSPLRRGLLGNANELSAWTSEPSDATLICGYFRASFAASIDVFAGASQPVVEHFGENSRLADCLSTTVRELASQDIGAVAMSTALFKQMLICIFRQYVKSPTQWGERLLLFRDPQIARVFGEMAARPGAPHTITSLAAIASLSRSAFMARFSQAVGRSPMAALRELRMQRAVALLTSEAPVLEHIAYAVGYGSRSGFVRAFRQTYGRDPWAEGI
jgi:AraC family transcriptional activator of mtrCDE